MKRFKIVTIIVAVLTLFAVLGMAASAEELPSTDVQEPVEETPEAPVFTVDVKYTSDSVCFNGISYETYVDPVTGEYWFNIVKDLEFGYVIYDVDDTPHIDGIRVNGDTIGALKCKIVDGTDYTVSVKVVYADGLIGDIAKMSDGVYDWSELLANPIILFQALYYVIAAVSIIVAAISAFLGKGKKVKTSDEIAEKVTTAATNSLVEIKEQVVDTVVREFTPILETLLKDFENVVKAVTLSNSKSKEAPLALLDVLHDASNSSDVQSLIASIRESVANSLKTDDETHTANLTTLQEIAAESELVAVIETPTVTHKSVF